MYCLSADHSSFLRVFTNIFHKYNFQIMVFSKSYHVPNNYYFHKGCTVTALDGQLLLADILGAISLHLPIIDYF